MVVKIINSKTLLMAAIAIGIIVIASSLVFAADGEETTNSTTTAAPSSEGLKAIGAALAIGIAGFGAAIGMAIAASATVGAMVENPEIFGKAFLFIVLIEAVAIYGLLIAILLVF